MSCVITCLSDYVSEINCHVIKRQVIKCHRVFLSECCVKYSRNSRSTDVWNSCQWRPASDVRHSAGATSVMTSDIRPPSRYRYVLARRRVEHEDPRSPPLQCTHTQLCSSRYIRYKIVSKYWPVTTILTIMLNSRTDTVTGVWCRAGLLWKRIDLYFISTEAVLTYAAHNKTVNPLKIL